jgi:hypothetical protein
MNKFEQSFNYEDVILRDITLGLISGLYRKVRWTNKWHDKEKLVTVPIYYGMVGNERFDLDAFVDDIIGDRPELNIDPIPRGHVELNDASVKKSEFSNPNVNMEFYKEENGILKKMTGKFRVLPIQASYKLKIEVDSEIDLMKCRQSLWDWIWSYKYFYITYNSVRLDCVMTTPDDYQQEMQREIQGISGKDDTKRFIEMNLDVHTFYPIEPKETKPTLTNCGRAIFKGKIHTLGNKGRKKVFVGGCVNKDKK